jgi:hypothetical protein
MDRTKENELNNIVHMFEITYSTKLGTVHKHVKSHVPVQRTVHTVPFGTRSLTCNFFANDVTLTRKRETKNTRRD